MWLNSHPVCQIIKEQNPGIHESIDSKTGSVAGDAVKLAVLLGFRRIFMAGMDFSFPFYDIYSRGSAYQRRYSLYFQNRLLPVETSNMNYIMKSSRAKKIGKNYTRASFLQYRESIEEMILSEKKGGIFILRGAGIGFEKIPDITIEECFSDIKGIDIDRISYIDQILSECIKKRNAFSLSQMSQFLLREDVFDEFIKVSLGEKISNLAENRYRQMLGRLQQDGERSKRI